MVYLIFMQERSFVESALKKEEDKSFDLPLRPKTLDEFLGQEQLRKQLSILIGAAKSRGDLLGHTLFSGPPGLGKTTLAHIVASVMGGRLVVTSGPVIEKAGDLAGILTSLKPGDFLFIDEIHRLNRTVEEYLYPAMENFNLDLVIDSGPGARTVSVKLHPFTLIGATTRVGLLTSPMRSRFAFTTRLDYYESDVLAKIISRSATILKLTLEKTAALEIAKRARGTPRIANHLLRWVRDFAKVHDKEEIDESVVREALHLLLIDERGLDEMDIRLLRIVVDNYNGGPVGLSTLAAALGEEGRTIEEVYEPYLIMQGLIKKTPKGREATPLAHDHLKKQRGQNV